MWARLVIPDSDPPIDGDRDTMASEDLARLVDTYGWPVILSSLRHMLNERYLATPHGEGATLLALESMVASMDSAAWQAEVGEI